MCGDPTYARMFRPVCGGGALPGGTQNYQLRAIGNRTIGHLTRCDREVLSQKRIRYKNCAQSVSEGRFSQTICAALQVGGDAVHPHTLLAMWRPQVATRLLSAPPVRTDFSPAFVRTADVNSP
jgi:hypothetical protein